MHNIKLTVCCFVLLALSVHAAAAGDSCTDPSGYTVDRRCYVPGVLKDMFPYNSVVQLIDVNDNNWVYCSGTIVNFGTEQYITTAHHCALQGDSETLLQKEIHAMTPDGRQITAYYHSDGGGGGSVLGNTHVDRDWAFYRIQDASTPFVAVAPGTKWRKVEFEDVEGMPLTLIAYGGLRIMSDADIKDFRNKYIEYLRDQKKEANFANGVGSNSIYVSNSSVTEFLESMGPDYFEPLIHDNDNMKMSVCTMPKSFCQGWNGASGGGFFDENGNFVGILSRGVPEVGGDDHGFVYRPAVPTKAPNN